MVAEAIAFAADRRKRSINYRKAITCLVADCQAQLNAPGVCPGVAIAVSVAVSLPVSPSRTMTSTGTGSIASCRPCWGSAGSVTGAPCGEATTWAPLSRRPARAHRCGRNVRGCAAGWRSRWDGSRACRHCRAPHPRPPRSRYRSGYGRRRPRRGSRRCRKCPRKGRSVDTIGRGGFVPFVPVGALLRPLLRRNDFARGQRIGGLDRRGAGRKGSGSVSAGRYLADIAAPLASSVAPVMLAGASSAQNSTSRAISSGSATRPSGMSASRPGPPRLSR